MAPFSRLPPAAVRCWEFLRPSNLVVVYIQDRTMRKHRRASQLSLYGQLVRCLPSHKQQRASPIRRRRFARSRSRLVTIVTTATDRASANYSPADLRGTVEPLGGCRPQTGRPDDIVISNTTPSTPQFISDSDQFESGAPTQANKDPRHLQDPRRACTGWTRSDRGHRVAGPEATAPDAGTTFVQFAVVGIESSRRLEIHGLGSASPAWASR